MVSISLSANDVESPCRWQPSKPLLMPLDSCTTPPARQAQPRARLSPPCWQAHPIGQVCADAILRHVRVVRRDPGGQASEETGVTSYTSLAHLPRIIRLCFVLEFLWGLVRIIL
jgi:hypothetical protein